MAIHPNKHKHLVLKGRDANRGPQASAHSPRALYRAEGLVVQERLGKGKGGSPVLDGGALGKVWGGGGGSHFSCEMEDWADRDYQDKLSLVFCFALSGVLM